MALPTEAELETNREQFAELSSQAAQIASQPDDHNGELIKEIVIRDGYFFFAHHTN